VLGIIGGVAAVPYFYRRVDEEIRRCLEARFTRHYQGLKVTIGSAELVEHEGIRVHDLAIVEPAAEGPRAEILRVEELFLHCQTDVKELLCREPTVTAVTVRRPVLRMSRRRDGSWSLAKLLPLPHLSDHPPAVSVENGTVEIFDPLKIPCSTLVLRDWQMTLSSPTSAPGPNGTVHETRTLQGTIACDYFRRAVFRGTLDARGTGYSLSGEIEDLEISPELCAALPGPLTVNLPAIGKLRGESSLNFRIARDPAQNPASLFHVAGQFSRGRIEDPRLPHPLTEINTRFHADNGGIALEELSARMNQAVLRMAYCRTGFGSNSPLSLQAEIRQLELDRQLLGILPPPLQNLWCKYLPLGQVDADVELEFDGRNWRPMVSLRCLDVSFTYYKFPYRVHHGKGDLELKDDRLALNLTAFSGSQPIRMKAEIQHPLSGPTGSFEAKGEEIAIDETLIKALNEKYQEVVRSLDPRGTLDCYYHSSRKSPEEPWQQHLHLEMKRCSICYNKFPYTVNQLRGNLVMTNHQWTFSDLEGYHGAARITGNGSLFPTLKGNKLELHLQGADVPLEAELRDALPPNPWQLWHDVQPRGVVDLRANIGYLTEQKQLHVEVQVHPQRETASITPVYFPYRMEKLQGLLHYQDGYVWLQHCRAEHGPVKIAAEGYGEFQPHGPWYLRFAGPTAQQPGLTVDRLHFDRDLDRALPERLKKAVRVLDPVGPINLRGNLEFSHGGQRGESLQSAWDVQIGLIEGRLQAGVSLENVTGTVTLQGRFDGQHFRSRGELAVDSLNYKDHQFTQVQGPIWIDDDRVLLGRLVDDSQQQKPPPPASPPRMPRPITAQLFGGTLLADGWVALGGEPRYALGASLSHASLARCALEVMDGRQNLQGDIMAEVVLRGAGASRNALSGNGKIRLYNADIYQLPLMISLLKILSIRPPDRNAFSTAAIDYRIEGEHIYFDTIDFNGDAISLLGKGDMDWQSNIHLNFHTVVGRGDAQIPIVREFVTGTSRGIMTLRVEGTLQKPQIRKEAFPVVNQALQELQSRRQEERNR
jgi:hypothetical protein